jgi:LysM repeat protein
MNASQRNTWLFVAPIAVALVLGGALLAIGLGGSRDRGTDQAAPAPTDAGPVPLTSSGGGHAARPASTATPEVTRAYPGTYSGTPTPNAISPDRPDPTNSQVYVVQTGDTLSGIAYFFGCTVEEIAVANDVAPDAIWPGQQLIIPIGASVSGPDLKLIPDSELVYGPASIHFDLTGFVTDHLGYLGSYTEEVEGRTRTGAEIVQLVAQRYSLGPRVLLALLELKAGWVTDPDPAEETLYFPMGTYDEYREGLFQQLSWTADQLNSGYYGWKNRDWTTLRLLDGTRVAIAPGLNPGTVAVQNYLAQIAAGETWEDLVGPEGFAATYERLFGTPFAYTVEPLVPSSLAQPTLYLPWEEGQIWYLTGGPHGGWGSGSGWAALDFAPHGEVGCQVASEWATAAAPGLVLRSERGEVVIDLDGDGYEQSGWVLTYLHVASEDRVEAGTWVERGDRIGHPSCEGGVSIATHLHFARRYNGEWIAASDGPVPLVLSGWTAEKGAREYDGTMVKGDQIREACECTLDSFNGLLSDNAP